jgi:multidrug efflux pump subunit AcrA (membrane-fusion protein)
VVSPAVTAILERSMMALLGRWTSAAFVLLASLAILLLASTLETTYAFAAASRAKGAVRVRAARRIRKRGDQLLLRFATEPTNVAGIRNEIRIVSADDARRRPEGHVRFGLAHPGPDA